VLVKLIKLQQKSLLPLFHILVINHQLSIMQFLLIILL